MTVPSPAVRAVLQVLSENFPRLGTEVLDAAQARSLLGTARRRAPQPLRRVEDFEVDGRGTGSAPVRARGYWPDGATDAMPALVFFHGGGFVLCDLDSHDAICRDLARSCGVVVVSVDYRRAPEERFPAAFDDACAVTEWVIERAPALGIDPGRVGVAGDSAGGNLAAAVAQKARDAGGPGLIAQVLLYPMLDPAGDTESYRRFAAGYFITAEHLRWYWDCYRGPGPVPDAVPYFSPPAAATLAGLPPALVVVAGFDPLADEARAYGARLAADGTATEVLDCAGLFHGFLGFAEQLPEVAIVVADIHDRIRRLMGTGSVD